MVQFMNLPAPRMPQNALLDLSGISNAIDSNRRNALLQDENRRQNEELGLRRQAMGRAEARASRQDIEATKARIGKMALAGDSIQDPAQRAAFLDRILKEHPDGANLGPEYRDPSNAFRLIAAEAGLARDPREDRMADLRLKIAEAELAKAQRGTTPDLQEVYTETGGKQKGYFQNGQFIPVGGVASPRSEQLTAADRKAILEADDKTQANASAISTLEQALELNKKANAGWGAGVRTSIGTNLPDVLVPDVISSPESGQAAAELDNAVISNALEQLKATFGGMPTEGERKILIDLQGSINQPREVRQAIYNRALALARQRLEINRQEAEKLRGGTYYKPGGAATVQTPPPSPAPRGFDLGDGFTVEVEQ